MPYANSSNLKHDRRPSRIDDRFTVDVLVNYIEWKLGLSREADGNAEVPIAVAARPILS